MKMPEYIVRMQRELTALNDKQSKLVDYLKKNHSKLDTKKFCLMQQQLVAMDNYITILSLRIELEITE